MLAYLPKEGRTIDREGCDGVIYPEGREKVPCKGAILRVNRYMVDNSDFLIACAWYPGNARALLEYARNRARRGAIQVTARRQIIA